MTEVDYRFRHKIGDELYSLYVPYDDNLAPEETWAWPIVKRTDRYVYVNGRHKYEQDRLFRFSIADLESQGSAYNRPKRLFLYTRPLPSWPLMPAEVRKPAQQAIGHTRNGAMTDASVIGRD